MSHELMGRLVIGIASSALFDLAESNAIFEEKGEAAYRKYQEEHLEDTLEPGVAFQFIKRLLSLNDLAEEGDSLIEVIVLSRNDPDTGLRVMRSIQAHELQITRAVFMQGRSPYRFMPAFSMCLFLSANDRDAREAVKLGLPAGRVLSAPAADEDPSDDLRIAFDFDGVLATDKSETVMQEQGLEAFREHEAINLATAHDPGPLKPLLAAINHIQDREEERKQRDPKYRIRLHVALVTARNAPTHERAIKSLKIWGVRVNDAFFLGGIEKSEVLRILKPHIFFEDQEKNLKLAAEIVPSVHIPFGLLNQTPTAAADTPSEPPNLEA
jgi:5'-nucleotidase